MHGSRRKCKLPRAIGAQLGLRDASKSPRVFPAGGIINLGIRTASQSFQRQTSSLPCYSDSAGSIIHPQPLYSFLLSFTLFAGREGNREESFLLFLPFLSLVLSHSFTSSALPRLPKTNQQQRRSSFFLCRFFVRWPSRILWPASSSPFCSLRETNKSFAVFL